VYFPTHVNIGTIETLKQLA